VHSYHTASLEDYSTVSMILVARIQDTYTSFWLGVPECHCGLVDRLQFSGRRRRLRVLQTEFGRGSVCQASRSLDASKPSRPEAERDF
jgi:hypothetical protein